MSLEHLKTSENEIEDHLKTITMLDIESTPQNLEVFL